MSLLRQTILICGASGVSGQAAANLALSTGARTILVDKKVEPPTSKYISFALSKNPKQKKNIQKNLIDLRPRQDEKILEEYCIQRIVLAPGIHPQLPLLKKAKEKFIPIESENDFGFSQIIKKYQEKKERFPYVIAITGTDGKSTCTAYLRYLINKSTSLSSIACGNFGYPLSQLCLSYNDYDVLVVECSSYQLERLTLFHPNISIILNIAIDHQDRYPNIEEYFLAKLKITNKQNKNDHVLTNFSLKSEVKKYLSQKKIPARIEIIVGNLDRKTLVFQNEVIAKFQELNIFGKHNYINACFCLKALELLIKDTKSYENLLDRKKLKNALISFSGLAHRLEYIGSYLSPNKINIRYYNDSKATTFQALESAIECFQNKSIILFCGGQDKGADFGLLKQRKEYIDIFLFGVSAKAIEKQIQKSIFSKNSNTQIIAVSSNLEEAFQEAHNYILQKKNAVQIKNNFIFLLSPGCASFDAYHNYQERGKHFRDLAREKINELNK